MLGLHARTSLNPVFAELYSGNLAQKNPGNLWKTRLTSLAPPLLMGYPFSENTMLRFTNSLFFRSFTEAFLRQFSRAQQQLTGSENWGPAPRFSIHTPFSPRDTGHFSSWPEPLTHSSWGSAEPRGFSTPRVFLSPFEKTPWGSREAFRWVPPTRGLLSPPPPDPVRRPLSIQPLACYPPRQGGNLLCINKHVWSPFYQTRRVGGPPLKQMCLPPRL